MSIPYLKIQDPKPVSINMVPQMENFALYLIGPVALKNEDTLKILY
jgi:hypothetical protein